MDPFDDLFGQIRAIAPEKYETVDLPNETSGEMIATITEPFLKQLVCAYREESAKVASAQEHVTAVQNAGQEISPKTMHELRMAHIRFSVIWAALMLQLETRYGAFISPQERDDGWNWNIRKGWVVWKAEETADGEDEDREAESDAEARDKKALLM
jgi:hypothetical protein